MARKQKQKETSKAKVADLQAPAVSPVASPRLAASPSSKHASVTPRGGTPGPSSFHAISPKSVHQPFAAEEQAASEWHEQTAGWHTQSHDFDEDGYAEDQDGDEGEGGDLYRHTSTGGARTPVEGAQTPAATGWDEPQEQQSSAGWMSTVTSALGFGSHSQAQTRSDAATAAQGVTRKSTLKKKPPANHEAADPPAAAATPPAPKRVAFTSYSSSFDARSSSPPLFPSYNPPSAPKVETKPMHTRSQSQPFARGWGDPDQPPPVAGGAWMNWGQEAAAYDQARKYGTARFATTIKANVPSPAPPPPPPAPASMRTSYSARGPGQPDIAGLQSQLASILGGGAQSAPQNRHHAPAMHRRQMSMPTQMATQTWQTWGNQPKGTPAPTQHAPQMQPANSWGSNDWGEQGQDASGWSGTPGEGAGFDDQSWGGKAAGGWGETADDGWGNGGGGGGGAYDVWGGGDKASSKQEKKSHKRGRSKSASNIQGWGGAADDNGWGTQDDGWAGKKAASSTGHGAWSEWDAIPEEDEEDEEGYDDDMYTDDGQDGQRGKRKTTHSGISYQYQSPSQQPAASPWGEVGGTPFSGVKGTANGVNLMPNPDSSKTMNFAAGRMTTLFELSPPRQGMGENTFIWSNGVGLEHAQRALFSRRRLAKDRIYWAFNPENDPRVSSLLRWIEAMANGLATIGLQKLLETGQRGALITNADYRTNASPGAPTQPAFDWITLSEVHQTCDRIFQESVVTYKPYHQVVVFVFLLSNSRSSMAVWRKKVLIPEGVRTANREAIARLMETLPQDKTVYVDEVLPPEPPPPEPPKKKKRGFWKRLFGIGRKK